VPTQLDRADFARPEAPWLVAVFTSATCDACAGTASKAAVLDSDEVAVAEVEAARDADVHRRYGVDAVPMVVVADAEGVVRASFVGPPTATDLWAAVAELREPGSSPEPHLGGRS
jgi:thioredoxin-like negative regulator of GroEL